MAELHKCPKQKKIVEYIFKVGTVPNRGVTETEIALNVYGVDRSYGHSNKAIADCLRRALHNGFVKRKEVVGKRHTYEYFIGCI